MYKLYFKRSSKKELRKIPTKFLKKILRLLKVLGREPGPQGARLLRGENRYFRLRQGDYRVIYQVDDSKRQVTIIKIGHRREVYR